MKHVPRGISSQSDETRQQVLHAGGVRQVMWGLFLAVLAAICWGVSPIAAKLALEHVPPVIGMAVRSLVACCLVSLWLVSTGHHRLMPTIGLRPLFWLVVEAILATVVGDALYFYALRYGHAGEISLIMSSAPLITLVVAAVSLGEPVTSVKVAGAAILILGLVMVIL